MKRLILVLVLALVPAFASAQAPYQNPPPASSLAPMVVYPGSANSVLAVDGTALAPSWSFSSESGTGFRRSATGTIIYDVIGSDAIAFGGNSVGIILHTASPLQWGSAAVSSPDTALARTAAGKISLTGTTPMLQLGGTTSSFPALKGSGANLLVRLADDSAAATIFGNIGVTNVMFSAGVPTISSGFGTSPSILSNNGSGTFRVNVGTGGVATSGVVGMPTAAAGWNCQVIDMTNNTVTRETASTTTTVTVTAAAAWAASDTLIFNCAAY
jgi:hypothetical protein